MKNSSFGKKENPLNTVVLAYFHYRHEAELAQGYLDEHLDLNRLCIRRPASTFLLRVEGDSMVDAGIFAGDILIVDRSLEAVAGDVVVASLEGEFTVKELQLLPTPMLKPRNAAYAPIPIGDDGVDLFGVVTFCLHALRGGG